MHTKLAGHLSLHDMIQSTIQGARVKLASDEGDEDKKKVLPFMKKKEEKKDEGKEKKSSAEFDFTDPDEIEKLASALEEVGEKVAADSTYIGGEKKQGGEVLATMSAVPGKQPYKKDSSKAHNIPASTPEQSGDGGGPAKTQTENDHKPGKLLKYTHSTYPAKGPLVNKTAAASVKEKIEALKKSEEKEHGHIPSEKEEKEEHKKEKKSAADEKCPDCKKPMADCVCEKKEKKSSALEYILNKVATFGAIEKKQGGETLDSAAEQGPKPPSGSGGGNNARSHISSNKAAIDLKKVEAKGPQKKMLAEVLTEPAQSKAHDSKVQENLRNATKGGVKIAAAKAFLQKIAEDENHPQHAKLKEAMKKKLEKKSMGAGMGAPAAAPPPPMPMMGR